MKIAVKLTMQGLIRALKLKEHELAEDVERAVTRPSLNRAPRAPRKGGAHGIRRR